MLIRCLQPFRWLTEMRRTISGVSSVCDGGGVGKIVWPHARSTLTMKCRHLYCRLYDNAAAFTSVISRRYRCHHGRATWVRLGRLRCPCCFIVASLPRSELHSKLQVCVEIQFQSSKYEHSSLYPLHQCCNASHTK